MLYFHSEQRLSVETKGRYIVRNKMLPQKLKKGKNLTLMAQHSMSHQILFACIVHKAIQDINKMHIFIDWPRSISQVRKELQFVLLFNYRNYLQFIEWFRYRNNSLQIIHNSAVFHRFFKYLLVNLLSCCFFIQSCFAYNFQIGERGESNISRPQPDLVVEDTEIN